MTLRKAHRLNAFLLLIFIAAHLLNHFTAVLGIETHLSVMKVLRNAYRLPGVEHILYGLFIIQIGLGLALVFKHGKPKGGWAWAQVLSGCYLAFFLLQHLIAVVATRIIYVDIDTNSYWAAAVVSIAPFVWYFAPYYTLAILAMFTHIAAALRFSIWPKPASAMQKALPVLGGALGVVIVLALIGIFHPFELPSDYQNYLDSYWES